MKKFTKFISHRPKFVLLVMTLLLFPSFLGYKLTGVNYDILSYLPQDLKSTQGQKILDEDFKNAATGMLILEGPWCRSLEGENTWDRWGWGCYFKIFYCRRYDSQRVFTRWDKRYFLCWWVNSYDSKV